MPGSMAEPLKPKTVICSNGIGIEQIHFVAKFINIVGEASDELVLTTLIQLLVNRSF